MSPQLLRGAGSYFFEGSPVGCLLVHGMGSTPYQVRSLGEYLAWQGLTVLGIRLPGHGTTLDEHEQTTAQQWLSAIDDGIDQLLRTCEHIFVVGNSLGGVLALAIAARREQDLAGLVTISTPVSTTPQNKGVLALAFLEIGKARDQGVLGARMQTEWVHAC